MNRRKFIASGAISASMLSVFPSFALTSNAPITLSNLGKGFEILSNKVTSLSVLNLSNGVKNTYQRLTNALDKSGYTYKQNTVIKLNEVSYMIPLSKRSLFGEDSKQIALIIKDKNTSTFYVLNENISSEFNSLVSSFDEGMKYHNITIDASEFTFPVKFVKQTTGSESTFVYKNKFNDTITLHNYKTKTKAIIS